jgi:hypothetical protein
MLISCIISVPILGQEYYKIVGEDDGFPPDFVMRFEVKDKDSYTPIKDVQVIFKNDKGGNFLSLHTNQNGVCIIIVMNGRQFPSMGTITITSEDYKYWKNEFMNYDFLSQSKDFPFAIYGMEYNWTFTSRPSVMQIISALDDGKYEIVDRNSNWAGGSPGCFEYVVELERLPRKIDLD